MDKIAAIKTCAGIILAAGSSSRLGMPKQQLMYNGKTLLQHTIDQALLAALSPIVVVTAADALPIDSFKDHSILQVINHQAQEGMASSIRCGVLAVKDADAAIIMVCDQPLLHATLLKQLIITQNEKKVAIVASTYNSVHGTPALFHYIIFGALLQLHGDRGAKKILDMYTGNMASVIFDGGEMDIDTKEDYAQLNKWRKA